jgi:hypothetical protein
VSEEPTVYRTAQSSPAAELIEVLVERTPIGALAARCGVAPELIRAAVTRQNGGRIGHRLFINLSNRAVVDQAIRRAVRPPTE